ncbi:MAG: hypothetical protein IPK60_18885 [Sandaracinaceae bacterium]|jgi:dienelactone hydrolase|nr:hypothetical protein [Sandaracinaceae bacterium]
MRLNFGLLGLLVLGLAACKGDPEPLICADPATTLMFPTPAWMRGERLDAPAGDKGVELLRSIYPAWVDSLALVDGMAQRPTFVIALDGVASAIDETRVSLYSALADGQPLTRRVDVRFHARVDTRDHRSIIVQPINPLPLTFTEGVLVIDELAVTGANVLPACDGSQPDAAYATALAALPTEAHAVFALPFHTATDYRVLNDLWTRLSTTPVLTVMSAEARTLASFGADAPSTEVSEALAPTAVSGVFSLPDYRDDGVIARGADGGPVAVGTTEPAFVVALPSTGAAPYPFILYQHGGGRSPTDIFLVAQELASQGFAFVAIDLPEHGHRAPAAATGTDLDFIHFDDVMATRSNFQQAVSDHMAVMSGLVAINAALQPITGAEITLDPARAFMMGMSIGAISGSISFATIPTLRGGAFFVGAAGYPELVSTGLFAALASRIVSRPDPEDTVLLAIGETILDAADPLAYAQRAEDRSVRPRPMIFMQAVGDPLIPHAASDQWARAFGAEVALPRDHDVEAMLDVPLPAKENFAWLPDWDHATRVLVQCPMNEIEPSNRHSDLVRQGYAQELVAHCFSTQLSTGDCEVIDTHFADH